MNTDYRSFPIPKEIEFNNSPCNDVTLNTTGEDAGRIESRRRSGRRDPKRRKHSKQSATQLCTSLPTTGFNQNRRRESLRAVSSQACAATQKFMEATQMEILLEYSEESCDCTSQRVRDENELSLSELAGLMAGKLDDAVERGLFSFNDSLSLGSSKKMYQDVNLEHSQEIERAISQI